MPDPGPEKPKREASTDLPARDKALLCAQWALEKKAYDMVLLNVGAMTPITEYFVICSGRSVRQTRAIVDHIRYRLKQELKQVPLGVEGETEGCWILVDCDDVVVHVFYEPTRDLYRLEHLWSEAPRVTDPTLETAEEGATSEGDAHADGWEEEPDWED